MPTLATVAGAKAVTSVSTVSSLNMCAKVGGQSQQIGKDARGRHFGPGPRTLNDQWIVAITARRETYDIVSERDVRKGVLGLEPHQSHGCLAGGIDTPHIAQHL